MSRRSSTRAVTLAAAAALAGVPSARTLAIDYSWNAASGTFQTAANWSSSAPGTFPNDSTDNAIFSSGSAGITVSFSAAVTNNASRVTFDIITFDLNFNTYTLTSANVSSPSLLVGNTQFGDLTIVDGTVAGVNASVGLSGGGTGLLTIPSGGVLNLSSTSVIGSSGSGTVTLSGGDFAHGGITLGSLSTGTGTMTVSSTSASVLGTGPLVIGSAGDGTLLIQNGGDASGTSCTLGSAASGTGIVTVVGASSTLSGSGTLTVGSAGDGAMTIKNGGVVTSAGVTIGNSFDSTGEVLVSGAGAAWNSSGTATIGSAGAAEMRVDNGGVVSTSVTNFASSVNGSADVTLSDALTAWNAGGNVTVGGNGATAGGTAVLTINPGATFNNTSGTFRINPPGTVNLNGGTLGAVTILNSGGAFNFSAGTLNLTGGGVQLVVGPGGLLGSTVLLDASRRVNVTNGVDVASVGVFILDGGSLSAGVLTNVGEVQLDDAASTLGGGTIDNQGRLVGNGRITASITNFSTGEIRAASPAERLLFTSTFTNTNNGAVNALNGGTVEFSNNITNNNRINLTGGIFKTEGTLINNVSGRISGRGTVMTSALTNNGQLTLSAGLSDVFGNMTNNPTSKLIVTGGGTATFYSDITSLSGAEIRVSGGSTAVFLGSVSGPATYTGSGTKIFEGSFSATDTLATPGSTIVEASASLTSTHIREASLTVAGNVTIAPNGTATGTSRLGALVVHDGGRLDLKDNKLIVVGGELGTWTGSAYDGITGLVDSGRGGGGNPIWTGDGIVTSDTRAIGTNDFASLGLATAGQLGRTTFGGLSVGPADVLVMLTYGGDANLDGKINIDDYGRIDGNVGQSGSVFGWFNGDFNYDGKINIDDYGIIDGNINQQSAPFFSGGAALGDGVVAIPEPAAAWLAIVIVVARGRLYRRRRELFKPVT